MSRPRGWIQDSGSFENLIKVVQLFDCESTTHKKLQKTYLPKKIQDPKKRNQLLQALTSNDGFDNNPLIDFLSLVGSRTSNNFVDSLIQTLIPGQNRLGIVDWACDNFLRFAYTLNFINYKPESDSFSITKLGLKLSRAENKDERYRIIRRNLLKYPPVVRILELLYLEYGKNPETPSLSKFEIGKELGFKGEDGFSTYSQNVFIQALNSTKNQAEKSKIRSNWEGSSDKYARMICSWLSNENIGWIHKKRKTVTVQIGSENFSSKLQSYQISIAGIKAFKSSRSYSSHSGTIKNVSFEMLATKGADKNYLRLRRALILQSIRNLKSTSQIARHLKKNNLSNISADTIKDDIQNFTRIGLDITYRPNKYKLADSIELLEIPETLKKNKIEPSKLEHVKERLREQLKNLDHKYLDILDFSIAGTTGARKFEVRTVELLNEIIAAKHLSGGNRPEIIGYSPAEKPRDCVVMDSKAYSKGFMIPASERDKMIRYIQEYKEKDDTLNPNKWWENFKSPDYPKEEIKFSFISSSFNGKYLNQLTYIKNRTNRDGCLLTAEVLLRKVDSVLNNNQQYDVGNFFSDLGENKLL